MKITEKTRVSDVLSLSRNTAAVLRAHGLMCAGCRGADQDTVGRAAVNYGLDLDALLVELNQALES